MNSVRLLNRLGVYFVFLPFITGTVSTPAVAMPVVSSNEVGISLPQGIFFFVNGVLVDCTAASGYSQNHVFDLVSNEIIGYRDANNPGLILDASGNLIGLINMP